jgi:hypothetical protein
MKLLVLTSEPISAQQLRDALPGEVGSDELEVMVVAPALQDSPIKFWVSDADDAIARAEEVRRSTVEQLGDAGVAASGDTGESDPLTALQDALITFPADRILVFTRPDSAQQYREDVDPAEIEQRFGVPVSSATVPDSAA